MGSRSWLNRYSAVMVGTVLVIAGFAAMGWWLVAVGQGALWQAVGTGIAAVVCFSVGLVLAGKAAKRRGGMLKWRPDRAELRAYRDKYRR